MSVALVKHEIMVRSVGDGLFEVQVICETSAPPHFEDGFGLKLTSLNPEVSFNDWYQRSREEIRKLVASWGVIVVDDVIVQRTSVWQQMVVDPVFNYLPWHSDGVGGEETIMLAHMDSRTPRQVPTLVAPSIQIQTALRQILLDETSGLYPGTRDELRRICKRPDAAVDFFEGVFLQVQHAAPREQIIFRALFERSHELVGELAYKHHWRPNSVLLLDTAHYDRSTTSRGFNRVVHGRMPKVGEIVGGSQPFRRLV